MNEYVQVMVSILSEAKSNSDMRAYSKTMKNINDMLGIALEAGWITTEDYVKYIGLITD